MGPVALAAAAFAATVAAGPALAQNPPEDVIGTSWDSVLTSYLPRVVEARDTLSYLLAMAEFCRKINDAHAFIDNTYLAEHFGTGDMNIDLAYIDGKTVVRDGSQFSAGGDTCRAGARGTAALRSGSGGGYPVPGSA